MTVLLGQDLARALEDNPDLKLLNPGILVEPEPAARKYHNNPTEYGGRLYDSVKEANRAGELDLEVKAGEIIAWFAQVRFSLDKGIAYVADFVVLLNDLKVRVEDTKGIRTRAYKIKAKLFEKRYGQKIVEI